jgi:hypothetical protein
VYIGKFLYQTRVVVGNLLGCENNLRHIGRHYRDATALQELLRRTAGVEAQRTGSYLSDTAMAKGVDYAADTGELLQVLHKEVRVNAIGVLTSEGEGNSILIKVVADRYLAAESVAPTVKVNLIVLIIASLNEYRHVEFSTRYGVDNANLIAEIRKADDDTVNFVTMLTEKFSVLDSVLKRLDGT